MPATAKPIKQNQIYDRDLNLIGRSSRVRFASSDVVWSVASVALDDVGKPFATLARVVSGQLRTEVAYGADLVRMPDYRQVTS